METQEHTLMTIPQVADYLQVSVMTVYNMRRDGRLPAPVRLGAKSIRWDRQDIDQLIDASKRGA